MRARRNKLGDDSAEVDMTPMLDIVFIMLIFFIVTANFLSYSGFDITRPPPSPDTPPPDNAPQAITVFIDGNSRCAVDGDRTDCSRAVLGVEALLANKPGASIILKVHEQSKTDFMVRIKDELDQKGYESKIEVVG